MSYYDNALDIVQETLGENNYYVFSIYRKKGNVWNLNGDYDLALESYAKSLSIVIKILGEKNTDVTNLYESMARVFWKTKQYDKAENLYQKALTIQTELFGKRHGYLAQNQLGTAEMYTDQNNYSKALTYIQKSLIANNTAFNDSSIYSLPPLENYFQKYVLLKSLIKKGEIFQYKFLQSKEIKSLEASLKTFYLADNLVDQIRNSHVEYDDKVALGATAVNMYEHAIEANILMFEESKSDHYLKQAFYFAEKSKSGTLKSTLSDLSAKGVGHIPDSLIALEQSLKVYRNFLQSKILNEKSKKGHYDTLDVTKNEAKLFETNRTFDSLTFAIEKDYPDYFNLKYKNDVVSVDEIQQKLPIGTAFIEYFSGDSNLYIFSITNDQFEVSKASLKSELKAEVQKLRNAIEIKSAEEEPLYAAYVNSAFEIYDKVLKGPLEIINEKEHIDRLVIVPDAELSYIPFDILLTGNEIDILGDYKNLPYLLRKYKVSNVYSATLLFNFSPNNKQLSTPNYIGFAPVYKVDEQGSEKDLTLGRFRNEVIPLKHNRDEVINIGKHLDGEYFIGAKASEKRFKKTSNDYSIIHLAMHAFVDDENPMNSKLMFYQDNDSIEDGYLHTFELFDMEFNADLVVLSACETGYGKLLKGEGLISLAKGFAYSGVPSVVMSHWQVDDQSTSVLMQNLYENLAKGLTKSDALRQAKLQYLDNASPNKQNPFFWGGFVVIGDDSPIIYQASLNSVYFAITAILLLIILLIFVRKRKTVN